MIEIRMGKELETPETIMYAQLTGIECTPEQLHPEKKQTKKFVRRLRKTEKKRRKS